MTDEAKQIPLVIDTKLRQPACVLIQAAYGYGDSNGMLKMLFDSTCWLVAPTPDMYVVNGTLEQWQGFADECKAKFKLPDLKGRTV